MAKTAEKIEQKIEQKRERPAPPRNAASESTAPRSGAFRIATFNVNSVRSRLPVLERWLPASGVDLLFLQETKASDADFPAAAFEAMGYEVRFCGEKSYNGVAVVSRVPLEARFGFGDGSEEPDFPTRVLFVKTPKIAVLNTYVPQGKDLAHPDYLVKKRFLERVRAFFDREAGDGFPFAWVGDLNVAPADIDVTHPENKRDHVCFHTEIREKFAWVASWGLTDLFRRFHPEEREYTFFDYRVKDALQRNIGWRIDHVLANGAGTEKALACFIDREPRGWERPSDHTPLAADFDL
ncbi:MAG: exodeoxyribonuclease III [Synergistaceae bacterium]|jgi:exodeoxyribonuclease-3|nr:exodeoxyribonuclease III [Synergistaceae bacterium]